MNAGQRRVTSKRVAEQKSDQSRWKIVRFCGGEGWLLHRVWSDDRVRFVRWIGKEHGAMEIAICEVLDTPLSLSLGHVSRV